jgi:hypothetical protein
MTPLAAFATFIRPGWPGRRSTTLPASSLATVGVAPPSLRHEGDGAWQRLMCWLLAPAPDQPRHPVNRLPGVRAEFTEALADIPGDDAENLRGRIRHARSLRELWHLRADVYRVVGVARSQGVAQERLARLNHHFPARAPRSQFGAL